MATSLTISKAREDLGHLVQNAHKRLDEYVITVNGSPLAVILSIDEYESWKETNEIVANTSLMKEIARSEKELSQNKGIAWEDAKKELSV